MAESSLRPISVTPSDAAPQCEDHSRRFRSSKSRDNIATDTMISGIIPALYFGQLFSLFPVSNAACKEKKSPHFSWLSLRVLYSIVTTFLIFLTAVSTASFYIQSGIETLASFQNFVFFLNDVIASCLFIRLASRWASLCTAFQETENWLSFYRYGNPTGLTWRMRTFTAVLLIFALVEHAASQSNTLLRINRLSNDSQIAWLECYYDDRFGSVKFHFPFSSLILAVIIATDVAAAFIWSYNDLCIVLITMVTASKFQHLNNILIASFHKVKEDSGWKHLRETYSAIRTLTETVEQSLSYHVLLSFVNNFFFLCVLLLHSFRYRQSYEIFYFLLCFGLTAFRAVSVSLCAASIFEKSQDIKQILFSVPSENYCAEVKRFLTQVVNDHVALTGCNYFSVTRSFLCAVFGTIVTYEIVLLQFTGLHSDSDRLTLP